MKSLWKTVWRFLKKLKIELPHDPSISLLDSHPKELKVWRLRKQKEFFFFFRAEGLFYFILFYFKFIYLFICSEFCHTLEWNSHGFTCVPHPDPPSHLPLHPFPLGFPSAPGLRACLMHPTWAGDLFHPRYYTCFDAVLLKHPTLSFSHRV